MGCLSLFLHLLGFIAEYIVFQLIERKASPFERGFYCNDDSIRYPVRADSVPHKTIQLFCQASAAFMILAVGLIDQYRNKRKFCLPPLTVVGDFLIFMIGFYVNMLSVDVTKITIGRLRPAFLEVCFGNNQTALESLCQGNSHKYITNFQCYGDPSDIRSARMSFPSGHTAFMSYTLFFIMFYLHRHFPRGKLKYPLLFVNLFFTNLTLAVILSRISDYRHHPEDVAVGASFGLTFAAFTVIYLLDEKPNPETHPLWPQTTKQKDYQTFENHNATDDHHLYNTNV